MGRHSKKTIKMKEMRKKINQRKRKRKQDRPIFSDASLDMLPPAGTTASAATDGDAHTSPPPTPPPCPTSLPTSSVTPLMHESTFYRIAIHLENDGVKRHEELLERV